MGITLAVRHHMNMIRVELRLQREMYDNERDLSSTLLAT